MLNRRVLFTRNTPRLGSTMFLVAVALAALAPLIKRTGSDRGVAATFPGWPTHLDGIALTSMPLTPREDLFVRGFPGRVGRFTDGQREIIIRWVTTPTRLLHPATDCFRGVGFAITPLPARRADGAAVASCFKATRNGESLTVCESLRDDHAGRWPDVSAWYWHALLGSGGGPWWSFVVAEAS
jgi:hypothetical protein